MTLVALRASSKSSAPGQYLGYGLQDVRLCHHLLKAPAGAKVSLEFIEDTAIHGDGQLLLEQSKSAISGNPISDSSQELWKSFANWATLCASGQVDPSITRFRMYVCPQKKGDLASRLHAALDDTDADALLTKIGKKVKAGEEEIGCNPKILEFLSANLDVRRTIIRNFELIVETDPIEPIREVIQFSVLPESLDDFCRYAIGSAKTQVAELIRSKKPPIIDATLFRSQLGSFIRKHGALGLLLPTTERPEAARVNTIINAAPVFVQQLLKVNMGNEHVVGAVSDFLRSDADRTVWAAEGRIVEESLEELNQALESHFILIRDEVEDLHSHRDEEVRGRQVYRQCVQRQESLEGRSVPSYFIVGTFNLLADSARVGWHPRFAEYFGVQP